LIIDPDSSATLLVELVGKLATELADVQSQIAETRANAPNSPQLATLARQASALQDQITAERSRVSDPSGGLAEKIAQYEKMTLEREFSIRNLESADKALNDARIEARRQHLYLERVVEPNLPDEATLPQRWWMTLTVFGYNVIGIAVLWLLGTGLREHAAARSTAH
jgi:capsular polysaccharide transport system permease protein